MKNCLLIAITISVVASTVLTAQVYEKARPGVGYTFDMRFGFFSVSGEESDFHRLGISNIYGAMYGFDFSILPQRNLAVTCSFDMANPKLHTDEYSSSLYADIFAFAGTVKFFPLGNNLVEHFYNDAKGVAPWFGTGLGYYYFGDRTPYYYYDERTNSYKGRTSNSCLAMHFSGGLVFPLSRYLNIVCECRYSRLRSGVGLLNCGAGIGVQF